jgi:sugar phosphate isomerase/epimerase
MQIGIFAKTFAATGALPSLQAVRAAGYDVAHFNMTAMGDQPMPETIDPAISAEIASASRATGIAIVGLSGTYNMIHPDPAERARGLARFAVLVRAAPMMGIRLVTVCTGTRHATDQWAHHPDNASAGAWSDLVGEMTKAVSLAEEFGVDIGVEPELANVVSSATLASKLIDELGSARIRIVLDPANLFEQAAEARGIVERAVDLLGDRIAMAHAKDRHADGSFAAAGAGVIDFRHFVRTLRRAGFDGPLVAHGLDQEEAPAVATFLRSVVVGAGG